jgi:hypothetical protein
VRHLLLFLVFALSVIHIQAQYDTEHWLPPFFAKAEDQTGTSNIRDHYLKLITESDIPFPIYIENGYGEIIETVVVSADSPAEVLLGPTGNATGDPTTSVYPLNVIPRDSLNIPIRSQSLHVYASQPFNAIVQHLSDIQGLGMSLKGRNALGNHFYSGHIYSEYHVNDDWNQERRSHFISVMATEDNTAVTFDMIKEPIVFINQFPEPNEISIILDAGESYVLGIDHADYDNSSINNANGTRIQSDKPIVCNTGSWVSGFAGGQDIGADQILPINYLGKEYIASLGLGNELAERVMVLATEDDTSIHLNGDDDPVFNLDEGEFDIITFSDFDENGNLLISSNKNIYVYQTIPTSSSFSQTALGFLSLPHLSCSGTKSISTFSSGTTRFRILAKLDATVSHNSEPLPEGISLTGNNSWVVLTYDPTVNVSRFESDSVMIINQIFQDNNIGWSIGWSGYNKLPAIGAHATTSDFIPCLPSNAYLQAYNFDSYNWFFNGELMTDQTSDTLYPWLFGEYTIQGVGTNCDELPVTEAIELPLCSSELGGILFLNDLVETEDLIYDLTFRLFIENLSLDESISNIQVLFNKDIGLPEGAEAEIIGEPEILLGFLSGSVNSNFDGSSDKTMLSGSGSLWAEAMDAVEFTVRVDMSNAVADGYYAQAIVNNTAEGPNDGFTGPFVNHDYSNTEEGFGFDNANEPDENQAMLTCFFSNEFTYVNDSMVLEDENIYLPDVSGVPGGTFSAAPEGLSIDEITGAISPTESMPGTYAITYQTTGRCQTTTTFELTVYSTLSTIEGQLKNGIRVFPNPSKGDINIKLDDELFQTNQNYHLVIYSTAGRIIRNERISGQLFRLSNFNTSGVYHYRLEAPDGKTMASGRFVIVN